MVRVMEDPLAGPRTSRAPASKKAQARKRHATRHRAAAKRPVPTIISRRSVLRAVTVITAGALMTPAHIGLSAATAAPVSDAFTEAARRAVGLFDAWQAIGREMDSLDAVLKGMDPRTRGRDPRLSRMLDLPLDQYKAAIAADEVMRAVLKMPAGSEAEHAIHRELLSCLARLHRTDVASLQASLSPPVRQTEEGGDRV